VSKARLALLAGIIMLGFLAIQPFFGVPLVNRILTGSTAFFLGLNWVRLVKRDHTNDG
jgi:hypothetical protein